jgi:hypothetical protein
MEFLTPTRRPPITCRSEPQSSLGAHSVSAIIGISQHKLRHLESIQLVREQRENGKQELAFNARPFILCGIPLRRPPKSQLSHTRRNGKFFLDITGHPRFGLPFGQDRLIPIWIATLAVKQKSRIVHFETAAQMLDFFRLSKDGRHYRRIVQGFQRIFAATIFFGTEDQPEANQLIDWQRFHFFDRMHLWFSRQDAAEDPTREDSENTIVLSEAFFKEIDAHRVPVEREVIAALANAPGILDFYLWLVWKSWTLGSKPAFIPLFGPNGLDFQLGTKEYSAERRFRQTLLSWIRRVKVLWPQCPTEISRDGLLLVVRSSKMCPAVGSVRKPDLL